MSGFTRSSAPGRRIVPIAHAQVISELRRIGATLTHQYSKVTTWTSEETRRYWRTRNALLALANAINARL